MPDLMEPCPPCKIILDGGIVELATDLYAGTTQAIGIALTAHIREGNASGDYQDRAHALSELWCHRAALLRQWAEEDRLIATEMIGGEYSGAYVIDGVSGIKPK